MIIPKSVLWLAIGFLIFLGVASIIYLAKRNEIISHTTVRSVIAINSLGQPTA